jgi:hypothetical protein
MLSINLISNFLNLIKFTSCYIKNKFVVKKPNVVFEVVKNIKIKMRNRIKIVIKIKLPKIY